MIIVITIIIIMSNIKEVEPKLLHGCVEKEISLWDSKLVKVILIFCMSYLFIYCYLLYFVPLACFVPSVTYNTYYYLVLFYSNFMSCLLKKFGQ